MEEEAFYSSAKHMIFLTKEQMFSIHMLTDTTQELHAYKTPLINLHIFLFFHAANSSTLFICRTQIHYITQCYVDAVLVLLHRQMN